MLQHLEDMVLKGMIIENELSETRQSQVDEITEKCKQKVKIDTKFNMP